MIFVAGFSWCGLARDGCGSRLVVFLDLGECEKEACSVVGLCFCNGRDDERIMLYLRVKNMEDVVALANAVTPWREKIIRPAQSAATDSILFVRCDGRRVCDGVAAA